MSERELALLRLMAQGLSNQEIGQRIFLALETVTGHNRRIFDQLEYLLAGQLVSRLLTWAGLTPIARHDNIGS